MKRTGVLKRFIHCQLRARERKKTISLFLSYMLNGVQKQEMLFSVPKGDRENFKKAYELALTIAKQRDDELLKTSTGIVTPLLVKQQSFLAFCEPFLKAKPKYQSAFRFFKQWLADTKGLQDLTFGQLNEDLMRAYRDALFEKIECNQLSSSGARTYFAIIKSFVNEARRRKYIASDIFQGIPPLPNSFVEKDYLEIDEFKRILTLLKSSSEESKNKYSNQLYCDIFTFLFYTGVRPGELRRLTFGNIQVIDGQRYLLYQPHKTKHKSGVFVKVPVHPELDDVIGRAFSRYNGNATSQDKIFPHLPSFIFLTGKIKSLAQKAGIQKRISLYSLRHSFVSLLLKSGASIFEVARLAGHTSPHMVMRHYGHASNELLSNSVNRLPALTGE